MRFRIGLVAIALSFLLWLVIAAVPLLGFSSGAVAGLVAGVLVVAEVLFWAGLVMAGKDTWQTIKARGWRHAPRELGRLLVHGRRPETPASPGARVSRSDRPCCASRQTAELPECATRPAEPGDSRSRP